MGSEKPNDAEEGWVCIHLLVLQRGRGTAHPLPLRLHLGGLLSRVLLVLLGVPSPLLDPESAGGEMLSLGITSKKVCVYEVFFFSQGGANETQNLFALAELRELEGTHRDH